MNTDLIKEVAKDEKISFAFLKKQIAKGYVVIPANVNHKGVIPTGIGKGLRTKINVNIGTSPNSKSLDNEFEKLKTALAYKTDTVMDLSIGGDIKNIRKSLLKRCPVAFGTVPIYEAAVRKKAIEDLTEDDIKWADIVFSEKTVSL